MLNLLVNSYAERISEYVTPPAINIINGFPSIFWVSSVRYIYKNYNNNLFFKKREYFFSSFLHTSFSLDLFPQVALTLSFFKKKENYIPYVYIWIFFLFFFKKPTFCLISQMYFSNPLNFSFQMRCNFSHRFSSQMEIDQLKEFFHNVPRRKRTNFKNFFFFFFFF